MSQLIKDQRIVNSTIFSDAHASVLSISNASDYGTEQSLEERIYLYDILVTWQGICMITVSCILILVTALGNILVISAIITTRRLRTVTNCFVMSLAVADFLVGTFVMPPAVAVHLMGSWPLGWILCDIWISLDILLCTASILSLCAISVDRYLAVTKPLKYSRRRRSKRLALLMILIVWLLALAITCPPMLGWYEPGRRDKKECRYNQNKGYVIYSASGSFFVPMIVMLYVYARISCVIASRHDQMTHIGVSKKHIRRYTTTDAANYVEKDFIDLTRENNSQDRRFSNQTIVNELSDVIMPEFENARPLLYLPTAPMSNGSNNKGQNGDSTQVISWKIPPPLNTTASYKYAASNTVRLQYAHSCPPGSMPYLYESHDSQLKGQQQQLQQQQQQQQLKSLANCIISMKKEHKTTQTLSIVVGGFIACWLPFFIYYLITPFLEPQQVSRTITNVLTWLGWLNSAINPFIYAFYSNDFRLAFWRIVFKRFCSNVLRPSQTQTTITSMRL